MRLWFGSEYRLDRPDSGLVKKLNYCIVQKIKNNNFHLIFFPDNYSKDRSRRPEREARNPESPSSRRPGEAARVREVPSAAGPGQRVQGQDYGVAGSTAKRPAEG